MAKSPTKLIHSLSIPLTRSPPPAPGAMGPYCFNGPSIVSWDFCDPNGCGGGGGGGGGNEVDAGAKSEASWLVSLYTNSNCGFNTITATDEQQAAVEAYWMANQADACAMDCSGGINCQATALWALPDGIADCAGAVSAGNQVPAIGCTTVMDGLSYNTIAMGLCTGDGNVCSPANMVTVGAAAVAAVVASAFALA